MNRSSLFRRLLLGSSLLLLLVQTLALPPVAKAQDAPNIYSKVGVPSYPAVSIAADLPRQINAAYEEIRWEIIGSGTMAFMNAMQTFFGQLAYDAADYIATGGKGQSSLYYKKGFLGYLQDVGSSAAGEYIGTLSDASFFRTIGFDLCRPPNPQTLLRIQLSLGQFLPNGQTQAFQRPQARCDFNDVVRNYDQVYQTLSNGDVLRNVDANLNTNANDLGVSFLIFNRAQEFVYHRQDASEKDRKEGNGYDSLRDIVSGRIRTPSETIREEANQAFVKDPKANQAQINSFILNQAWNMGPVRLAMYTGSVFINTLASRMLSRVFEEGIGIFDVFGYKPHDVLFEADNLLEGNREDARKANIDLRTPNLFQGKAYDVLSDLQACPDNRGTWNCVIDEGLAQALHSEGDAGSFTIREAIERGLLKGAWRLYPTSNDREERDPLCYTYGYCAGNLRKLRLMRILPVGFEFAANDPKNVARCATGQGCVTLAEVVDGFSDCNAQGLKDDLHPWCKLIDPNWALTLLPQQCALTGYGDVMLSDQLGQRREECQDIQTCLQRNDRGECVGGYGNCVAEKSVYRFGGQECSAKFASCRTYSPRVTDGGAGDQVSFLRNTLDYGNCSEDNVGCLWYATTRDASAGRSNAWVGTASAGPRVYLDKAMETCPADQEGCTRLLAVKSGESSLNLIANASFERTVSGGSALEAWSPVSGADRTFVRPNPDGERAADGATAAGFSGGFVGGYRQVVDLAPGHNYAFSAFVRRSLAGVSNPSLRIAIRQYPSRETALARTGALSAATIARDFRTVECSPVGSEGDLAGGLLLTRATSAVQASINWTRVQCGFTANAATRAGEVVITGEKSLVDAVMLEEGLVATTYVNGLAQGLEAVHHKVAPDELDCRGESTDNPLCANYAKMCRQTEAGCDGYTDTNGAFPEVAAQLNGNDSCPAACVGYAEYRKLASPFDLVRNADAALDDATEPRAEYFIPSTAEQCTQAAVGCEEFTVVDAAQAGGEGRAYFNSLRFCEQPADDSATYFTWEGSDEAGYQLRTWSLKRRTDAKPGMTPPEGAGTGGATGPRIVVKRSGDLFTQKNPLDCDEAAWRSGGDPDCRQFYDAAGQVFYRYYSQTVLSTPDCRTYRLAGASENDCRKTGGDFRATEQACLYQAYAPESGSCSAAFAGCRAYAGSEAGSLLSVFSANGASSTAVTGARTSSESLLVGDQSYRADVPAGRPASVSVAFPSQANGLYRVSFWAKATASSTLIVRSATPGTTSDAAVIGTARLTSEWQRLNFGLFDGVAGDRTSILWTVSGGDAPVAFFVDEIAVQQLRDIAYVRKGTWQTPAQCDQTAFGAPEPQAMLGCREYRNRGGETVNARRFSQLCRPAAIGCRAFIDTRNSENPYEQTFSLDDAGGPSVTRRPADRFVYVIDDKGKRCDAENASCRAFGKPAFSADRRGIEHYDTVYLKDDITKYSEGLCKPSELFCEEFTTAEGREYFKDPQNHLCEYREQVRVEAQPGVPAGTYSGWFVTGGSQPCYPNALASGQVFQVLRTGDASPTPGYQGWAATCPAEQNECTEYRDPSDKDATSAFGRPYYFIKNDLIDTRSCGGSVDPSRGCVLLRNMSDGRLLYSTEATIKKYQQDGLRATAPVDCTNTSQPGCGTVRSGRCVGTRVNVRRAASDLSVVDSLRSPYAGGSCSQDTDCAAEAATSTSGRLLTLDRGGSTVSATEFASYVEGIRCDRPSLNDANLVVKVKVDRDCSQWLGCATGETVYDPSTNRYREVCTKVALCDRAGDQGGSGAAYCGNYVNRTSTSTEPVLTAGAYFDASRYVSRPTGIGARDYSGRAIPNAFQVVDLQSRSVSQDASLQTIGTSSERRLVVAVKMPPINPSSLAEGATGPIVHTVPPNRPNQAEAIGRNDGVYTTVAPKTLLCRHRTTGQIGYFIREEALRTGQEANCYFSLRGESGADQYPSLQGRVKAAGDGQDLVLDQAYPRSLCRAYPEADAPFSSSVVAKWDLAKNPIRPTEIKSGYQGANICAYGEDCSCSYKRVDYEGGTKPLFFGANSEAVPPGICIGGPRDGQACLPSEVFNISNSTSTSAKVAEAANNNQTCGSAAAGGRCVAFSKAEIVRGVMGSCLEYDTTRSRGKLGQETYSCLDWNPSPIVGGQNDPYRYVQTAGYFPPQNSGQYYCTSKARVPQNHQLGAYDFSFLPEGVTKLDYDDAYTSDADAGASGNERGAYFNGQRPEGSHTAGMCEDADDDQDDDGPFNRDPLGLRLVATGRGEDASYTETFYGVNPKSFASWQFKTSADSTSADQRRLALEEQNMSFVEIRPFENPNGNGRLACGYNEDWVDGVHVDDYDDLDKTGPADRMWRSAFFGDSDLQTYLTRGSEAVLTGNGEPGGRPLSMPCVRLTDGTPVGNEAEPADGASCYFKYWEGGYRATDQKKFVGFQSDPASPGRNRATTGFDGLRSPVFEKCDSDKPYYSIRAVFQTEVGVQSASGDGTIEARNIRGPWRFVGFWVSACGGKASSDNHFIYMNVRIQNADICRELAEVRSVRTNEDAAFTDRVWKESKYSVPVLNIQYGQSFAPFSSALNTGPAGEDPLYQTGGKLAGSSSIRPPTFLASGFETYAGPVAADPKDRYAYLSNLFARIYRVYRFNEQRIGTDDRVCVAGPNQGRKCVPDAPAGSREIPAAGRSVDCRPPSGAAACDTGTPPPPTMMVCNALSGINAGRACGTNPDSCHTYAVDPQSSPRNPRPLLAPCLLQTGWTPSTDSTTGATTYRNAAGRVFSQRDAAGSMAFRCGPGSVRRRGNMPGWDGQTVTDTSGASGMAKFIDLQAAPSGASTNFTAAGDPLVGLSSAMEPYFCTAPTTSGSEECPMEVTGTCEGASGQTAGTCSVRWEGQATPVRTGTSCFLDTDCSFTAANFWRNPRGARTSVSGRTDLDGRWGIVATPRSDAFLGPSGSCVGDCTSVTDAQVGETTNIFASSFDTAAEGFVSELDRFPGGTTSWAVNLTRADGRTVAVSSYRIGACQPLSEFTAAATGQVTVGTCSEGSDRAGDLCLTASDSASFPYRQWSSTRTCNVPTRSTTDTAGQDYCRPVSRPDHGPQNDPGATGAPGLDCRIPGMDPVKQVMSPTDYWTSENIPPSERNMNNDNNACTAEVGYQPLPKLCPDPSNEFCGLIAYDMRDQATGGGDVNSLDRRQLGVPLPTDVTLGHYTPSYLGFRALSDQAYDYIDYYTPRPPRIAAPPAQCPAGMSCGVQDLDRFAFNGVTQGIVNVVGGQYRATIRFFGWAAHEQMAIRRLAVDWGDGTVQDFNDVKLKNRKPFCSVQKECYSPSDGFTGLTCQSDNDCPLSAQACRALGSCKEKKNVMCAQDADCRRDGSRDSCEQRAFFGDSSDACEAAPFEFAHVYTCPANAASVLPRCTNQNTAGAVAPVPADVLAPASATIPGTCYFGSVDGMVIDGRSRPTCTVSGGTGQCLAAYASIFGLSGASAIPASIASGISCGPPSGSAGTPVLTDDAGRPVVTQARCSQDPSRFCRADRDCAAGDQCIAAGLAPPGGCWDDQTASCRHTPRVFIQDNWGWCTGECRATKTGSLLSDSPSSAVKHPFGGCYTPVPFGGDLKTQATRLNTRAASGARDNSLAGSSEDGYSGVECSIDRPNGSLTSGSDPRRNYRPWIVFPGSIQLRPRN